MKANSFANYQLRKNPLKVFPSKYGLKHLWKFSKPPEYGFMIGVSSGNIIRVILKGRKREGYYSPNFWKIKVSPSYNAAIKN